MFLIMRVHSSNEHADTADYAVVELTPALCQVIRERAALVQRLKATQPSVHMLQYWSEDGQIVYRTEDEVFPAEGEYLSPEPLDSADLHSELHFHGLARIATCPPANPALWKDVDCHFMEVYANRLRWTCLSGDIRLSTWDVPLSVFGVNA
jgi:hypothetical protein